MQTTPVTFRWRRAGALALLLAPFAAAPASAGPSKGELQQQLGTAHQHEQTLQGTIDRENARINGFQGTIDDLTTRERAIQATLDRESEQLHETQRDLRDARAKLTRLRTQLTHDRKALAEQLVAQYELPQEDIVSVVVNSHGFSGLLEQIDDLDRVREQNVRVTTRVGEARLAVAEQTQRLSRIEARRKLIADATLVQRDQVARLRIAVVDRQMAIVRERSRDRGQLGALQDRAAALQGSLKKIERQEAAAAARAAAAAAAPSAPATGAAPAPASAPFASHGGSTGFFQAPGTNYSVGVEPTLAARLDQLGKALGLHLEGISGYRTPQHSVEVGGFPNDPHTRGEASDTPGVEGVPEATLNEYGLTRPFGGAAEADHIQLLGGG
ncbi:D-Ala-D-Ala carboxypeptidase family metallohydrolase [Conexibacter sp. CPCC 206217]|uniref:D-Ala-D-Ala carboxypeptidase family metallohydrolase n=1 Tax=Conexibacter sp. CPCC 206217 TaxID=3064574 RepID=UPI0027283053|nr:D-Ala-D-Ala carboxypeptidase family metallohydrolase [Conexibacter sp. CPCC 206217]MDO8212389.1 D-Ala-D-Ala carboxypeptidase family metallohydrolase [Conexibacter sp. CPCC 206217]